MNNEDNFNIQQEIKDLIMIIKEKDEKIKNLTTQLYEEKINNLQSQLNLQKQMINQTPVMVEATFTKSSIEEYLKNNCKSVVSLNEFMNKIELNTYDIENFRDDHINAMIRIITRNLKKLKPTERPLQYSHKKLMVYSNNNWEIDNNNKFKQKLILFIQKRMMMYISELQKSNDKIFRGSSGEDLYNRAIIGLCEIVGDVDERDNLYKKIYNKIIEFCTVE